MHREAIQKAEMLRQEAINVLLAERAEIESRLRALTYDGAQPITPTRRSLKKNPAPTGAGHPFSDVVNETVTPAETPL
jgi:hypothetical protein